jgi:hypothetical protein
VRFQEDLHKIRNGLRAFSSPNPSAELVKKTRAACYAEMEAMRTSGVSAIQRVPPRSVPRFIWAAVFALVVLTGILIISFLPGFGIEESLSLRTVLIFSLIVQNAVMLFFAPVLIQKFRLPTRGLDLNGNENFVA